MASIQSFNIYNRPAEALEDPIRLAREVVQMVVESCCGDHRIYVFTITLHCFRTVIVRDVSVECVAEDLPYALREIALRKTPVTDFESGNSHYLLEDATRRAVIRWEKSDMDNFPENIRFYFTSSDIDTTTIEARELSDSQATEIVAETNGDRFCLDEIRYNLSIARQGHRYSARWKSEALGKWIRCPDDFASKDQAMTVARSAALEFHNAYI